ncbi:hypothetical protein BKA69DRAFT_594064 [Paraphysoderma sedebokerense]|nr:hypothetical protein BKA69DRAFT_594064 [Paraphysoderma sedebokerense]
MFARFLPSNIMHQLHDDMISLFWTLIDYTTPHHNHPSSDSLEGSSDLVFRSDRSTYSDAFRFILLDCHNTGQHLPFYRLLTSKSIIHISDIITDSDLLSKPLSHVALESTIIGLSKSMLWYQYGFETPQGPIPNKAVNGSRIRQFTQYIIRRIGGLSRNSTNIKKLMKRSKPLTEYEYWKRMKQDTMDYNGSTVFNSKTLVSPYSSFHVDPLIQSKFLYRPMERKIDQLDNNSDEEWRKQKFIVIFSRSKNRKIINEAEIITELEKAFDNYLVIIVRLEEMELNDIIQILQQTDVAIGMHGSILILSMFMKPGSLLVELFPYGIFSHHYTPYKTMAQLEGMNISYVAWENRHNNNTVTFPANHKMVGGINHLSSAERQDVLKTVPIKQHRCCEDPAWLFRIYQDTRVHVPEIIKILREHFQQMSRQEN